MLQVDSAPSSAAATASPKPADGEGGKEGGRVIVGGGGGRSRLAGIVYTGVAQLKHTGRRGTPATKIPTVCIARRLRAAHPGGWK